MQVFSSIILEKGEASPRCKPGSGFPLPLRAGDTSNVRPFTAMEVSPGYGYLWVILWLFDPDACIYGYLWVCLWV